MLVKAMLIAESMALSSINARSCLSMRRLKILETGDRIEIGQLLLISALFLFLSIGVTTACNFPFRRERFRRNRDIK